MVLTNWVRNIFCLKFFCASSIIFEFLWKNIFLRSAPPPSIKKKHKRWKKQFLIPMLFRNPPATIFNDKIVSCNVCFYSFDFDLISPDCHISTKIIIISQSDNTSRPTSPLQAFSIITPHVDSKTT